MSKLWFISGIFSHLVNERREDLMVTACVSNSDRQAAIQSLVQWVVENYRGVVWDKTDASEYRNGIHLLTLNKIRSKS